MNELKVIDERIVLEKEFRIYGDFENPLFLAKDVANWIEYESSSLNKMLKNVDDSEKVRNIIPTLGGKQEMWLLTEDGLYEVLMQSRKPVAKEFKKQVKTILKSIRKNGAYMTEETLEKALTSPDFLIELATKLKEEQEARKIAEAKIEEQKPLVEFAETVANSSDNIDMNELAKLINNENILLNGKKVGRNKLFQWLREKKILMENNLPYQKYIDSGYFNVIETVKQTAYGSQTFRKTLVTGRGQLKIVEMIRRE